MERLYLELFSSALEAEREATLKAYRAEEDLKAATFACEEARKKYTDILHDIDDARAEAKEAAKKLEKLRLDSDSSSFSSSRLLGSIPGAATPTWRDRLRAWFSRKKRAARQAPGRIVRAIYESLVLVFAAAMFIVRH